MDNRNPCPCDRDKRAEKSKRLSSSKLNDAGVCLNHLTELDVRSSCVAEVPITIQNLVNLVKLNLSSNELTTLPLSFAKFQQLTELILSHNKFALVPQCLIDGMPSITTLDLSHNKLLNIGVKPFCIQQLLTLNVSNNTSLNNFPQWLWSVECKSLKSLDISFTHCLNKIEVDPYQNIYGIAVHLKNLNMINTNCDIFKLDFVKHLKNLRTIVLDNNVTMLNSNTYCNFFCSVPLIFNYRFKFIISLSMTNVNLSNIGKHAYFNLPNLQYLNLSNNSIAFIPDSFCDLKHLEVCDMSCNQIISVPKCFKNLKKLKILSLSKNLVCLYW